MRRSLMKRSLGILLPIFSLPSRYGIGTLGKEAYKFVDFLAESKVKYWQLLPLNPTSYGDSPYQSFSAFALNPYFIDLEELLKENYITKDDVKYLDDPYSRYIDYGKEYYYRFHILRKAFFNSKDKLQKEIDKYIKENSFWVKDYAAFMVIKGLNGNKGFLDWKEEYKHYSKELIENVVRENFFEYNFWIWTQYMAFTMYSKIKKYANSKGVKIIGDIPIYVAMDSADCWSHLDQFQFNEDAQPSSVAGVPPDYFSATGQLWGNPLYDYEKMEEDGFKWWKNRVANCAKLFDVLRIDHFRGMESYWAVPYGEETAINGKWIKGPGIKLVNAIKQASKGMEIIAEDLGFLTQEVFDLKKEANWPGLKIYEFAFSKDDMGKWENGYLPENYEADCVAYLGTHDNDTLQSFLLNCGDLKEVIFKNLKVKSLKSASKVMKERLVKSKSKLVIFMMQDILDEGGEYRFNTPSVASNNWRYRLNKNYSSVKNSNKISSLIKLGRR